MSGFFLGFEVPTIEEKAPSAFAKLLKSGGDYLHFRKSENQKLLGKPLSPALTFQQLEEAESHMRSLMRLLYGEHFEKSCSLILFPKADFVA